MKLTEIMETVQAMAVEGSLDRDITGITCDSRRVMPGNLFVAVRGAQTDGHRFVNMAIDRGAAAVVFEQDCCLSPRATRIKVRDARRTMALAADCFYNHPSQKLKVVGVTGTNGKTTTAFMVKTVLEAAGIKTGLLGTVQYEIGTRIIPALRTTPESVEIQDMFSQMLRSDCGGAVMEVSSHALDQHRVAGVDFDVAVFTNLTQDHLDYHHTMENYFEAKAKLFGMLGSIRKAGRAVVNADNEYGRRLAGRLGGDHAVVTYGVLNDSAIQALDVRMSADGTYFVVRTPRGSRPVHLPLIGRYNVSNALAAIGAGLALDIDLALIEEALANMRPVRGRLESVPLRSGFHVFVDYAHTEDALNNVLGTVHELTNGRLITVFGCGGDRDKGKRAPMGRVAAKWADIAILTSDNPRTEDPREILRDVEAGFPPDAKSRCLVMEDRCEAIERALDMAQPGDTVVIAGKGHETYQEINNTFVPFHDRHVVEQWSERWKTVRVGQVAAFCGAALLRGDPSQPVSRISTDTRNVGRGDCFIALRGPHFDGHEFLNEAAERGASAAVVSRPTTCANNSPSVALLQVSDTLTALHKLAANYRRLMPPATRVIAVSGANGKTTTKEMIAAVLAQRFRVVKTHANDNNQIGVPQTVIRLAEERGDFGVIELGSNHPGEMRRLAEIVQPDVCVVTNIGPAHVEFFGDEAGVAKEEGTPLEFLSCDGQSYAVLNADDRWVNELRGRTRATIVSVGIEHFADIRASDIRANGDIKFRLGIAKKREDVIVRLKTLGRHQIYNALQAAAIGYMQGMDLDEIREGLESVQYPPMRMELKKVGGIFFLNDSYNANPASMRAALQTLREAPCAGRKIAVLGDMLELGAHTQRAHLDIGAVVANCGLSALITVGQAARWIAEGAVEAGMDLRRVMPMFSVTEVVEALRTFAGEGDMVLLKASRRVGLEKVLGLQSAQQ
ncbi:MAG: UDP-N-acetylmuramoyl-L-alanyl-D-glutamate--2,6-diaminopimelate ligase [Verrucomicrobia bacterium]|nr:UDP-N-acetylmuramoyl-L-alanyl-D-glutamate--2,6-diaminopimelate ligase [Verrucomicrobiota bacterium]